jgi:hypothetical protein
MTRKILKIFLVLIFLNSLISFQIINAQRSPAVDPTSTPGNASGTQPTTSIIELKNPLKAQSIEGVLENLSSWLIKLGAPVAALMIIIGGIQILFSGGDPAKFKKGQSTIVYTAIGYGIIILGSGVINIIKALLEK